MTGIVISFKSKFGFGFLKGEDGKEIFFHAKNYHGEPIEKGMTVEYDHVVKTSKGMECRII